MFTTLTFWIGTLWGFCCGVLAVWHCLVKPMAKALGLKEDAA